MYKITFKENRKYELVVNNNTIGIFYGRDTLEVDDSIIESKDFESDKKYFVIEKVETKKFEKKTEKKDKE